MAMLKDRLDAYEGQPEQMWRERKAVSVGERGQSYQVTFVDALPTAVYAIDGGIITDNNVLKCDKLILIEGDNRQFVELFVELKGRDIEHAISQMEATLKNNLFKDASVKAKQARIIGRNIPRNSGRAVTEIAKKIFLAIYKCRLEFKTGPAVEKNFNY